MGAISKCCCGDCCLSAEDMPYTSVTLIAPTENCEGGPGGGVGAGVGEGEGDPEPPVSGFSQFGCCYQAEFVLNCQPEVETCELWAKRKTDWGFNVEYYDAKKSYIETQDPDDCTDCPCIVRRTKSVDATATSRVFFGHKHRLARLRVNVGKAFIKCNGDESPVCKFYVAVTYEYEITEGKTAPIVYQLFNKSCSGFDSPNCSVSTSWSEEYGTDSDTCPEDAEINYLGPITVALTRAKFFDEFPEGQVTISAGDTVPFACCDGKTGCTISGQSCGLSFGGSNCFGAVPEYPEFSDLAFLFLHPCPDYGFLQGPLWFDPSTNTVNCYQVKVNGMHDPQPYSVECVYDAGECYEPISACIGTGVGVDTFVKDPYAVESNSLNEGASLCNMLDVDYLSPGFYPPPDCLHGDPLPSEGDCVIEGCCIARNAGLVIVQDLCFIFDTACGRKIKDYSCSTLKTDYSVGDFCLSLPNVTLEFA